MKIYFSLKKAFFLALFTSIIIPQFLQAKSVEITVWFQGNDDEIVEWVKQIKAFNEQQNEIFVKYTIMPHGGYNEQVGAAAMSKKLPDILQLDAPFLAGYVWSQYIQPIEPYISTDLLKDMTPSNKSQGRYPVDNKLYAIGMFDSAVLLYGNKKYLEKINARIPTSVDEPWTRSEFEEYMEKLAELPEILWPLDLRLAYGVGEWYTYAFSPMFQSMGCDLINRKTWTAQKTLNAAPCIEAAQMMQGWAKKGWIAPASAGSSVFFNDDRQVALKLGGNWGYKDAEPFLKEDLVAMPYPKFGGKHVSPNGTWIWAITKSSKNPKAAGKFIEYLVNTETIANFADARAAVPGLSSAIKISELYQEGGALDIISQQAEKTAFERPPHPAYPVITVSFANAINNILSGGNSKRELTNAAKKIDDDIEDNSGYPPYVHGAR